MVKRLLPLVFCACSARLEVPDDVTVSCVAACPDGFACVSGECIREELEDTTPPGLTEAIPADEVTLIVTFSEAVDESSASDPSHYAITPALAVRGAEWTAQFVRLTVSPQVEGETYMLEVRGVADLAGNVLRSASVVFTGVGQQADTTPPDQLIPPDGARLHAGSVTLVWSARALAGGYVVDVATDPDFASPIAGSPFTPTESSLKLEAVPALTYYWRVRAAVTAGAVSSRRFSLIGDAIYVLCTTDPCTDDATSVGNIANPRRSINAALADAKNLGIDRVLVANRPGNVAYDEVVYLLGGVSLYGGYDATFTTRTRTLISTHTASTVLGLFLYEPVTLDGFTIVGGSIAGDLQYALLIEGADNSLSVRNCEARSTSGAVESVGAFYSRMSYETNTAAHFADSEFFGGPAATSAGLRIETASATVMRCYMQGGSTGAARSYGLWVREQAVPWVLNSVIVGGGATLQSVAAYGPGHYLHNTLRAGQAPANQSIVFFTALSGFYPAGTFFFFDDNIAFSTSTNAAVGTAGTPTINGNLGVGFAIGGSGTNYTVPTLADVGFVNPTTGDYHLTAATPVLHSAQAATVPQTFCADPAISAVACTESTLDFDGVERTCPTPGSDCWSRGAFEL